VANVKGSALTSRVLWVQLQHGNVGWMRVLQQASPELRNSLEMGINKAKWYPFDQFIELNLLLDRLFGKGDMGLIKDLGRYSADANLRTIYRLFYKVGTVHWILGRGVRLWSAHYDSGYAEVATRGPKTAIMRIRGFSTPHPVHCLTVLGESDEPRDAMPHARRRALPARVRVGIGSSRFRSAELVDHRVVDRAAQCFDPLGAIAMPRRVHAIGQ
jgi:hypothetical protein